VNNKALTLSLVMAVIAVFFVQSYVTSIEDEAKKKFGTEVLVLKAKTDIKENDTINETMIEFALIPKRFLEPDAVAPDSKQENEKTKEFKQAFVGTVALVPVKKGEQITYNKITSPGARTGLATQIAPGRRAIAVNVNEISGVSKLLKPGDRVDLIAVIDMGGGKDNKIAKTILQDVVVLSVGRRVANNVARVIEADAFGGKDKIRSLAEDTTFTSVTLEVEPQQAQTMALITSGGDNQLMLSLRNNDDTERAQLNATAVMDVLGPDAARVRMPAQAGRR
jgi:pilus assembly protein CpaB